MSDLTQIYTALERLRAVRYAGHDPAILRRFRKLRTEDSCSMLVKQNPKQAPWSARLPLMKRFSSGRPLVPLWRESDFFLNMREPETLSSYLMK